MPGVVPEVSHFHTVETLVELLNAGDTCSGALMLLPARFHPETKLIDDTGDTNVVVVVLVTVVVVVVVVVVVGI